MWRQQQGWLIARSGSGKACLRHPTCPCNRRFVASLVVHEGALVANYPFDGYADGSMQVTGKRNPSPDDSAFMHLATTYANLHTTMHKSLVSPAARCGAAEGRRDWERATCMGSSTPGLLWCCAHW